MSFDEQGAPHLSCETRKDKEHTIVAVEQMKRNLKHGLRKMLYGLAQSMWRYDFDDRFKDMLLLSQDTMPERLLFQNGYGVCFELGNQLHFLPFVMDTDGINMYGKPNGGHAVPWGFNKSQVQDYPKPIQDIINKHLTVGTDCVIIRNDLLGQGDAQYLDEMIDQLVDVELTITQITLLSSVPYVFNVQPEQLLTAKNVFDAIRKHYPVIFTNKDSPDKVLPVVEQTGVSFDPALFDIYTHWMGNALSFLGIDYNTYEKRAQVNNIEAEADHQLTELRRLEKLHQREQACERISELFNCSIKVHSVIDEMQERDKEDAQNDNSDDSGNRKKEAEQ